MNIFVDEFGYSQLLNESFWKACRALWEDIEADVATGRLKEKHPQFPISQIRRIKKKIQSLELLETVADL